MGRRHKKRGRTSGWSRATRYATKFSPQLYQQIVEPQLDTIIESETQYQATHNLIIEEVRRLIQQYGNEAFRLQAYIWAAQGFWYCSVHFTDKARLKCAVQKFLRYKVEGLIEEILRRIAFKFGIVLPDWDSILKDFLKLEIVLGRPQTVWGIPMVKLNTVMPIYATAETTGLSIRLIIKKPDGTTLEYPMIDIGDGNYKREILFDQKGPWLLEVVYPDGFKRKKLVYVD